MSGRSSVSTRIATKRRVILTFRGGYHGRTAQTMALTTAKNVYRGHFEPLPGSVYSTAYPYCYRAPVAARDARSSGASGSCAGCSCRWEEEWDLTLHTLASADDVAAVVVEPVLGEGGYVVPPSRLVVDDVLLSVDEPLRLIRYRRCHLRMCVSGVHDADSRGVVEPAIACAVDQPGALSALHVDVAGTTPDRGDDLVPGDRRRLAHGLRVARRRWRSAPIATRETVATKKSVANAFTCGGIPFWTFR